MNNLTVTEYKKQRVLTTQQIAEAYGTSTDTITKNFNRNKDRYTEGKHYIRLKGDELRNFKANGQIDLLPSVNTLYLWTEKGAFLHAKSLNTDTAWEVYDRLVDTYFQTKENRMFSQQLSPELQMFGKIFEAVARQELQQKQQAEKLNQIEDKVESIKEVVALSPNDWRKDTSKLISRMALQLGGYEYINQLRAESYKYLEERMGVSLNIRLTNKRRRMADEGICKSRRDKLNQLDVIADDKKLIEGYVAIIKEMSVKYGVSSGEVA